MLRRTLSDLRRLFPYGVAAFGILMSLPGCNSRSAIDPNVSTLRYKNADLEIHSVMLSGHIIYWGKDKEGRIIYMGDW
jgi:hypothetical protein